MAFNPKYFYWFYLFIFLVLIGHIFSACFCQADKYIIHIAMQLHDIRPGDGIYMMDFLRHAGHGFGKFALINMIIHFIWPFNFHADINGLLLYKR